MQRLTHYYNGKVAEPRNRSEARAMAEKLAEYEDAEEKGMLVKLPQNFEKLCNVQGDYIYVIAGGEVCKLFLTDIEYGYESDLQIVMFSEEDEGAERRWAYPISDFGKTVFLTPEEAQQALKARDSK